MPDFRPSFAARERIGTALGESLSYFAKPSSQGWFPYRLPDGELTHERQVRTLQALERILAASESAEEFHGWCLLAFDVYRSVGWDGSGEVLFTAYCEPVFTGSTKRTERFRYPLYTLPADLVKEPDGTPLGRRTEDGRVVPYYTRGEIEGGRLLAGSELVWLADPFEVYIAHVQGSARVNLPEGRQMCVGYAGKTDHPYTSVGQHLVEDGRIQAADLSLATLRRFFREHPEELSRVLAVNASYVFFIERDPGPYGSLGARVTPRASIATDKSVFPRGGLCAIVTRLPAASDPGPDGVLRMEPTSVLVLDQDTGGAIRSAGRCDVFIGTGDEAERIAGYTREEGRLYYLFLKDGALLP
jgi:membrane-bound lytic murein transglycosylase A